MSNPYRAELMSLGQTLAEHGYTPTEVYDTEETIKSTDWQTCAESILATDEGYITVIHDRGNPVDLSIILGNEPGVALSDWQCVRAEMPFMDAVLTAHTAKYE